ncbi:hypothetical protein REPUB_Repub15cG0026400 [Reevesia pubescens]
MFGLVLSNTEAVMELYDNMLQSVNVKRTMPPNASLRSMIENCKNHEDIKLLFDVLQNLRRFRLSNLRIHYNFNCNLCQEVTRACARVGAIDFGKKALWQHNVYGLTPSIASAHHLLLYAKVHDDAKLMVEIMKLLKRNNVPLQAGTADIVFRLYPVQRSLTLSGAKKPGIRVEVEKLVNEWPWEVIKNQKEEDRKALVASLKSDIPAMVASLLNMGLAESVNLEDLSKKEILS